MHTQGKVLTVPSVPGTQRSAILRMGLLALVRRWGMNTPTAVAAIGGSHRARDGSAAVVGSKAAAAATAAAAAAAAGGRGGVAAAAGKGTSTSRRITVCFRARSAGTEGQ